MTEDWTLGDIFEDIAERVATARARALMGERHEALVLLQRARMDYLRFSDALISYPGGLALDHSIQSAQQVLREERDTEHAGEEGARDASADGSVRAA